MKPTLHGSTPLWSRPTDAVPIDSTELTIEEVLAEMLRVVRARRRRAGFRRRINERGIT